MSVRRLAIPALVALVAPGVLTTPARASAQVEVMEATITELQEAMASGVASSVRITAAYLARIDAYDRTRPGLRAMVWINPAALEQAAALDAERVERGPRGPLHGIPVIVKDNYGTTDMPTSGGSLALATLMRPDDAFQVRRLREAGAVILGKSNMHELASGITTIGSLGGQTLNPYDPTRNPGGSSGGTGAAIAASFAAVGWGSDTCGSIRIPAAQNDLVGLRPTKGLSSIAGIMPLSHTQDVGGPLARTVRDLAIALDATVGSDTDDPATAVLAELDLPGFVASLDADALRGARIGVLEGSFGSAPDDRAAGAVVRAALERMAELGAEIVVAVAIPGLDSLLSGTGLINHEFKWDLIDYLAETPGAPVDSLGEMLELGLIHQALVGNMRTRNAPEARDTEGYRRAMERRGPLRDAMVAVLDSLRLDAFAFPTLRRPPALIGTPQQGSSCQLSAHTGLPSLSAQAGFTNDGLPIGIELLGRPFADARLVAMAYSLEQGTENRQPPRYTPPLVLGNAPDSVRFAVALSERRDYPLGQDAIRAIVLFTFDPVMNRLGYRTQTMNVELSDVYAVVLRRADDQGRWFVLDRLSGPGEGEAEGVIDLGADLRRRLENGEVFVDLYMRGYPFGTGARVVRPPG